MESSVVGHWRLLALAAVGFCLTSGDSPADAQALAPSEIVAHYRAYNAALSHGDYAAAEREAAAALAAAQAADDPKIGVLAFNLARLRAFELGMLESARAPAQLALAHSSDGVRSEHVRLILLLTDLKSESRTAQHALDAAMISARTAPDADVDFHYRIARAWGLAALREIREASAEQGFGHAVDLARRMTGDNALDLAFALSEHGALLVVRGADREGYERFQEAARLLSTRLTETSGTLVSPGVRLYAEVSAWMMVVQAKSPSRRYAPVPRPELSHAGMRPCAYEVRTQPRPVFPRPAMARLSVGAVVLRIGANPDGSLKHVQVVGAVPRANFSEAVIAVTPRWRVIWKEAGNQCRRDTDNILIPIVFRYD